MNNPRQDARREICKTVDEMIANLHQIKRTALHMDSIMIMTMARMAGTYWNQLIAVYKRLDSVTLPPEKKIVKPEQFDLG